MNDRTPSAGDAEAAESAVESGQASEPERQPESASQAPEVAPATGRRGPAWTALLLALVALGLAGGPWWLAWQEGERDLRGMAGRSSPPDSRLEARLADLERQFADLDRSLAVQQAAFEQIETVAHRSARQGEAITDRLDRLAAGEVELRTGVDALMRADAARERQVENTVAGLRRAFSDLAEEVTTARPPDSRAWRIAEAGYLMRIANQRARLERDVPGALALLAAADRVLADVDDFGLVPVREALLDAQAALSSEPRVDRVALYLELEALGLRIDAVSGDPPRFDGGRSRAELDRHSAVAAGAGWWPQLQQRLGGLVDFRIHRDAQVRRLRTPDDTFTLQHNLRLRLAQAQLALLRGEQEVWRESLLAAAAGADRHADTQTFLAIAGDLEALAEREIQVSAPDISAPLRSLEAFRTRSPRAPDA